MIFNSNFLKGFDVVPNGKRLFLGFALAYFQERIKNDRNFVLSKIDTVRLYSKNLYYGI
jgi:fumarylacetoacetate (FAA) hydrolase family protein